jgi:hypothetical protein
MFLMIWGHDAPLLKVAVYISRSKSVKFLIALITPEDDQAAVALSGY